MSLPGVVSRKVEDDGCNFDGGDDGGGGGGSGDDDGSLPRMVKSSAQPLHVGGVSRVMPEGLADQKGGGRGV